MPINWSGLLEERKRVNDMQKILALAQQKRQQDMQDMIQTELIKAQIGQQYGDPLKKAQADILGQMFGSGQGVDTSGGAVPVRPQSSVPIGGFGQFRPEEMDVGMFKLKRQVTPQEKEQAVQEEAYKKSVVETASKQAGVEADIKKKKETDLKDAGDFISGLAQMYKNTEAAMPKTSISAPKQRIKGIGTRLGAFTGVGTTPQQVGELSTLRIRARSLIKKFEGGRLTDQDVADAVKGMTDVGKTSAERLATIVNLATAIGTDKGLPENISKQRLASQLGMTVEQMDNFISGNNAINNIPSYNPQTHKLQRNKRTGEIRVVPK